MKIGRAYYNKNWEQIIVPIEFSKATKRYRIKIYTILNGYIEYMAEDYITKDPDWEKECLLDLASSHWTRKHWK